MSHKLKITSAKVKAIIFGLLTKGSAIRVEIPAMQQYLDSNLGIFLHVIVTFNKTGRRKD